MKDLPGLEIKNAVSSLFSSEPAGHMISGFSHGVNADSFDGIVERP